jgi:hypothetical protein
VIWTQDFILTKAGSLLLGPLHQPSLFGYFQDRVSWTICQGRPWTEIPLISSSQVARFADMSD